MVVGNASESEEDDEVVDDPDDEDAKANDVDIDDIWKSNLFRLNC